LENNRWEIVKQDPKKPIPMPVSDYFLEDHQRERQQPGAAIPEMIATPNDHLPIAPYASS
jgi:hypothetical protein